MTGLQPLPSVNPHVVFQLLLLGEHNLEEKSDSEDSEDPHLTNRTGSPFFPRVGSLVTVASPLVAEGHLAELALVRLDPKVDSNVAFQVALLHELLRAVRTLVPWTDVDQHVLVETVPPVEFFSTIVALVLLLAFVTHPMVVKARLGDKSQTADGANVRIGIWMVDLVVKTPCVGSFQNLVANLADETLLRLVRVTRGEVGLQRLPAGKLLLAHVAGEAQTLLVGLPVLPDVRLQGLPVLQLAGAVRALEAHRLGMLGPHMARQQLALWEE